MLFASASVDVDKKGREALVKLAEVLADQKDLEILVEGHTDNDRVVGGVLFKDNWDLSVLRATSVVRILTENPKLDPKLLTAAGRSEFHPLDPENKAKNRRIEVILAPNLNDLFEVISN